jgi:HlyD family secretion protein
MSNIEPQRPNLRPGKTRHLTRQVIDSWPLLVWLGVLAVTIWAYTRGVEFNRMNGTVAVYQEAIQPIEGGRVKEILVKPGEFVTSGMPVATLETELIDQKIERLERRIEAQRQDRIRRYRDVVIDLESELQKVTVDRREDEVGRERGEILIKEYREAVAANVIPRDVLEKAITDQEKVLARLELYTGYESKLNTHLTAARKQLDDAEANRNTGDADDAYATELEILRKERENMTLRAARSGGVYRIEKEPNEIVRTGEAVVRIVAEPTHIVGFLPQDEAGRVSAGDTLWVASSADRHTAYASKVIAVSPRMSNTPDRASPLPNKMLRGREITLTLPEEMTWVSGQTVVINLKKPGRLPFLDSFLTGQ